MPDNRAWSSVAVLGLASALAGCPPASSSTDSATGTGTTSGTTGASTGDCAIGALGCPCTKGGACDPGLVCGPDEICVDPGGTSEPSTGATESTTTGDPDPSTSTTTTTEGTTDSSSTGPAKPCDPADGQPNFDCMEIDPNRPYCAEAGVCGGCSVLPIEGGCAKLDPEHPICNPEDDRCVACTVDDDSLCTGDKPACDLLTNECTGCYEHSHCPGTACDILKGECFPPDKILYVRVGVPEDGECTENVPLGGTIDNPYCYANLAIAHAQDQGPTSGWTFKFLETNSPYYHGKVLIPGVPANTPVSYAFIHEGSYSQEDAAFKYHTRIQAPGPVFVVGENVTAYINNFTIFNTALQSDVGVGIGCLPGANVFFYDGFVTDARGPGIRAIGCNIYLKRASVHGGRTEGIDLACAEQHCELHMENSYVTDNGYVEVDGGGGIVAENATLHILYSTILNNNNEPDPNDASARGDAIHCVGDAVDGTIRNSVIASKQMGNFASIKCDPGKLTVTSSLLDSEPFKQNNHKIDSETILGYFDTNTITGEKVFKNFPKDFDTDVLKHAFWQKGDPRFDFDGEPRIAKDGEKDFPGADVLSLD